MNLLFLWLMTPLMLAIEHGLLNNVKYLIEQCHSDVEHFDRTVLGTACSNGRKEIQKYLVTVQNISSIVESVCVH